MTKSPHSAFLAGFPPTQTDFRPTVVFLFSVACCSEEVNSLSTTSILPVNVGLILFRFDKNLFLSLPEYVVVSSTYTEFSMEALPEQ